MFMMSRHSPGRDGGGHLRRRGCIGETSEASSGTRVRGVLEVMGGDVYAKDLE